MVPYITRATYGCRGHRAFRRMRIAAKAVIALARTARGRTILQGCAIVATAFAYVSLLFAVASIGDRRAARRGGGKPRPDHLRAQPRHLLHVLDVLRLGRPCLASAASEFLAIYIGPIFVFMLVLPAAAPIIRLAKAEKITSIADFLAARYGKSLHGRDDRDADRHDRRRPLYRAAAQGDLGLGQPDGRALFGLAAELRSCSSATSRCVVALLLAVFAIAVRHPPRRRHRASGRADAGGRHGIGGQAGGLPGGRRLATFFLFDGPAGFIDARHRQPDVQPAMQYRTSLGTWVVVTTLSGFAIIMLPRQFHVAIVENRSESELKTAAWVFPRLSRGDKPVRASRSPSPERRWSASAPAPTSTCCRCRCSTATTSSPWPPSSAVCRRRPRW